MQRGKFAEGGEVIWELFLCINATFVGCTAVIVTDYPSEESCYRALAAMQAQPSPNKVTAYCRPKKDAK